MKLSEMIAYVEEHGFDITVSSNGRWEVGECVTGVVVRGDSLKPTLRRAIKEHKSVSEAQMQQEMENELAEYKRLQAKYG